MNDNLYFLRRLFNRTTPPLIETPSQARLIHTAPADDVGCLNLPFQIRCQSEQAWPTDLIEVRGWRVRRDG